MNTRDLKTLRQQLTKLDTALMNPAEPAIANVWLREELEAFHAAHC